MRNPVAKTVPCAVVILAVLASGCSGDSERDMDTENPTHTAPERRELLNNPAVFIGFSKIGGIRKPFVWLGEQETGKVASVPDHAQVWPAGKRNFEEELPKLLKTDALRNPLTVKVANGVACGVLKAVIEACGRANVKVIQLRPSNPVDPPILIPTFRREFSPKRRIAIEPMRVSLCSGKQGWLYNIQFAGNAPVEITPVTDLARIDAYLKSYSEKTRDEAAKELAIEDAMRSLNKSVFDYVSQQRDIIQDTEKLNAELRVRIHADNGLKYRFLTPVIDACRFDSLLVDDKPRRQQMVFNIDLILPGEKTSKPVKLEVPFGFGKSGERVLAKPVEKKSNKAAAKINVRIFVTKKGDGGVDGPFAQIKSLGKMGGKHKLPGNRVAFRKELKALKSQLLAKSIPIKRVVVVIAADGEVPGGIITNVISDFQNHGFELFAFSGSKSQSTATTSSEVHWRR